MYINHGAYNMNEKIAALKASFEAELSQVAAMAALEALRVGYLG